MNFDGRSSANPLGQPKEGIFGSIPATGKDQYGRMVAVCPAGGLDLGDWLVRGGLAVDSVYYSKGRCREAEPFAWSR
jgi:endonuclease YncB( thermonuclease family)